MTDEQPIPIAPEITAIITEIQTDVDDMRKTLESLKFQFGSIVYKRKALEKHPMGVLTGLRNWVKDTKTKYFDVRMKIWRAIPEEQWANYEAIGVKNLTEQLMLKEADNALRARWKQRPRFKAPVEDTNRQSRAGYAERRELLLESMRKIKEDRKRSQDSGRSV